MYSSMQSQKYTVEVYEFPKYNGDDEYFQPDHIMYTQIFTWGYHDLQNNIQSYKIHAPEMLIENTYLEDGISDSPIITLIDNENNYYNFNDLEIEKLPEKKYKIIIIQISHIPIRYDLKRDNDGNLIGTEVVEYYDNNGNKVNATDDYYSDVYQIKIEEIDVIALICDKKIPFEREERYYFYSSVLYLPAYTQERTFIKRFEEYFMPADVEAMLNNDPDTQLTLKFLHTFTPNKIYYYYEFYDKMLPTRDLIDVLTLRYESEVSKLKAEIELSLSPERANDKAELLNALLEQINEEHKLPKQQSQIYLNKIKEIKNRILQRELNSEYKEPERPVFSVICTNMNTKLEYYTIDLQTDIILQKECEVGYPYFQEGYGVRFNDNPHIYTIKDDVEQVPPKINRLNVFELGANANIDVGIDLNLLNLEAEKENERKRIEQVEAEKEEERKEKAEQQEQERKRIEEEEERMRIEIEAERKIKEAEEKRKNKEIEENKEKEEVFWFNIKIGVTFLLSILLIFVIIKTRVFS